MLFRGPSDFCPFHHRTSSADDAIALVHDSSPFIAVYPLQPNRCGPTRCSPTALARQASGGGAALRGRRLRAAAVRGFLAATPCSGAFGVDANSGAGAGACAGTCSSFDGALLASTPPAFGFFTAGLRLPRVFRAALCLPSASVDAPGADDIDTEDPDTKASEPFSTSAASKLYVPDTASSATRCSALSSFCTSPALLRNTNAPDFSSRPISSNPRR